MTENATYCKRCGKSGHHEGAICEQCRALIRQSIKDGREVYNEMRQKYAHLRRLTPQEWNMVLD